VEERKREGGTWFEEREWKGRERQRKERWEKIKESEFNTCTRK